jgi:hypothetical protein
VSYTYASTISSAANMLVIDATNPEYLAMIPNAIDDAEQRLYRELDLISTVVRDTGGTLTANSRNFTLPQTSGRFVVTESMSVFTPVSTTTSRRQLTPVTREFLDAIWGDEMAAATPSIPEYYAMITDQQIIVGPSPDAAYTMEVTGTIRPTPLSATNTTTLLTLYLPDLWLTAFLIFGAGYLKDYGAATDDPNAAGSWEAHYQRLLPSANTEEMRKRYASQAWTSKQTNPIATPQRV